MSCLQAAAGCYNNRGATDSSFHFRTKAGKKGGGARLSHSRPQPHRRFPVLPEASEFPCSPQRDSGVESTCWGTQENVNPSKKILILPRSKEKSSLQLAYSFLPLAWVTWLCVNSER